MPTEIEVKINITTFSLQEIKERIKKVGAELFKKRRLEVDEYLDKNDELKKSDRCLRLRDNKILTYKGPQKAKQKLKIREEIEVLIGDGEKLKTILERIDYKYVKRKEKYRTMYILSNTTITIDETPMGNFIEVEGTKITVPKIINKLGFTEKEIINTTYNNLWKEYKKKHNITGDMEFKNVNTK